MEIFKYMIESLSVIPFSSAYIYCELGDPYKEMRLELDAFIKEKIPKSCVSFERNLKQNQWQESLEPLISGGDPNEPILYHGNHDHIFVDANLQQIFELEKFVQDSSETHDYISGYVSSFPELTMWANAGLRMQSPQHIWCQNFKHYDSCSSFTLLNNMDACQMFNKRVLKHVFFDFDYGDGLIGRTDAVPVAGYNYISSARPAMLTYVPHRELFRHFDGYSHALVDVDKCPPLEIPNGFWDKGLDIVCGSSRRHENDILLNPLATNYTNSDRGGADIKCLLNDIPMFWNSKINNVTFSMNQSHEELVNARNKAVTDMMESTDKSVEAWGQSYTIDRSYFKYLFGS